MYKISNKTEDKINKNNCANKYFLENLDLLDLRLSCLSDDYINSGPNNRFKPNLNKIQSSLKSCDHSLRKFQGNQTGSPNYYYEHKHKGSGENYNFTKLFSPHSTSSLINKEKNTISKTSTIYQKFLHPIKKKTPETQVIDIISQKYIRKSHDKSTNSVNKNNNIVNDPREFPFKSTPSGNLKINSDQVVYQSKKLSILVANPKNTKINIHSSSTDNKMEKNKKEHTNESTSASSKFTKNSLMDSLLSQAGVSSFDSLIGQPPTRSDDKILTEYEGRKTCEILEPELNLERLGDYPDVDWKKVKLPENRDLVSEFLTRIQNKKNTDCVVQIDDQEFNCHLIVLQCFSELFDSYTCVKKIIILSENCDIESFRLIYEWMISGTTQFRKFTGQNVLNIFTAAEYLKIHDLVEQAWTFIDNKEIFNEKTAFLLYADAKQKNLEDVCELMLPRIQTFFLTLVSSQDWLDLELDDVKNLLSSYYIYINSELEVFMSAVRWLKHDWTSRSPFKFEVINCVRFGNFPPWQLVDIKRNTENPEFIELVEDPAISKLIDDGLAFVIIKNWSRDQTDDFEHWKKALGLEEPKSRNWSGVDKSYSTYREFLIFLDQHRRQELMGDGNNNINNNHNKGRNKMTVDRSMIGDSTSSPIVQNEDKIVSTTLQKAVQRKKKLETFSKLHQEKKDEDENKNEKKQFNKKILEMFTPSKNNFARLRMNRLSHSAIGPSKNYLSSQSSLFLLEREVILVFGGIDPYSKYDTITNSGKEIFRYNPDANYWENVGQLPEPRHYHCVQFLQGRVFIVGGADPREDETKRKSCVVNTVWSFDPVNRSWFSERNLDIARQNFGLVVSNQYLYAVGGEDRNLHVLDSIERFDSINQTWMKMAPMLTPRSRLSYAKYRGYIWVVGGLTSSTEKGTRKKVLDSIECYNLKTNQWTIITKLNRPRCLSCLIVMYDRLYLLGGAGYLSEKEAFTCSLGSVEVWDITTACWKLITEMSVPRHGHTVTYIGTQIVIIGGVTTLYMRTLKNTECFCTRRMSWIRGIKSLPTSLSGHASVSLPPVKLMNN